MVAEDREDVAAVGFEEARMDIGVQTLRFSLKSQFAYVA